MVCRLGTGKALYWTGQGWGDSHAHRYGLARKLLLDRVDTGHAQNDRAS